MRKLGTLYELSASDLVGHAGCARTTALNRAVVDGLCKAPPHYPDPALDVLIERGRRHEAAYVVACKAKGLDVVDLDAPDVIGVNADLLQATVTAMKAGTALIVQGALKSELWTGRPDILRRVERASALGAWSYEVMDTKLAREAKAGALIQLCLYSNLLRDVQGFAPQYAHIVAPGADLDQPFNVMAFRLDDYGAYFRRVRHIFQQSLAVPIADIYPDPVERCELCRWLDGCDNIRRKDDHPSFVAGLSKAHTIELRDRGVATLAALAIMPLPLTWKPQRGAVETYTRLREQARVQLKARKVGKPIYEALPAQSGLGLAQLPPPNPGDIFLDLEGAPFVQPKGREYLFGYVSLSDESGRIYTGLWARNAKEEKDAFETFIDAMTARIALFPDFHIYHFSGYETGALKRLMGRYATREDELDTLLRATRFVDLYGVVRQGVRCGIESYSIKKLEAFYNFTRQVELKNAGDARFRLETALELGDEAALDSADVELVERYNEDDCVSTLKLRDWLEEVRKEVIANGETIERRQLKPTDQVDEPSDDDADIAALVAKLTADLPVDASERSDHEQGRWLLAQCLNWHRREKKAVWWEYFRLADLSAEDLVDERAALSGLYYESEIKAGAAPIHRYRFLPQETDLRGGEELRSVGGTRFGSVDDVSLDEGWIDIKKRKDTADIDPDAVFGFDSIRTDILASAIRRVADDVAGEGCAYPAALALLSREKLAGGSPLSKGAETPFETALRLIQTHDTGVLPIQGPPGAGKTFTGAHMIAELVAAGKTVGVTANSHKVILNLLEKAVEVGVEQGITVEAVHKGRDGLASPHPNIDIEKRPNAKVVDRIGLDADIVGGTAWFWADPDAHDVVDVLFVDEAAQMSLANVLAVSHAAPLIVLLGDPRQLDQPSKGSHPEGSDVSSLQHILGDGQTMPTDRGLFLAETWRLHPDICTFTSELFYEGRLEPVARLEKQRISGKADWSGAGLRYLPVKHSGCSNLCLEEVDAIEALIGKITTSGAKWTSSKGVTRKLTLDDILIVAPFNAQVFELEQRLPGAHIGTVDKFQGQERPIVIYSMTSSSASDSPRGMDFLFSLNRLNVATSRARSLCVLVASPALFDVDCRTPEQMKLANALCRYIELATLIRP